MGFLSSCEEYFVQLAFRVACSHLNLWYHRHLGKGGHSL